MSRSATFLKERQSAEVEDDAVSGPPLLGTGKGTRRRNYLLVAAGIALILLSGLVSYLLLGSSDPSVSVYVARQDILEDDLLVLGSEDLGDQPVRIATLSITAAELNIITTGDAQLSDLEPGERTVIAKTPISEGSPLTWDNVQVSGPGQYSVERVGLVLEAGPYPQTLLEVGAAVNVIRTSGSGDRAEIITSAVVADVVAEDEVAGPWFVTLLVARSDAVEVADLASRGSVRLSVPDGQ